MYRVVKMTNHDEFPQTHDVNAIKEGLDVLDANDEKIGTVDTIKFGEENSSTIGSDVSEGGSGADDGIMSDSIFDDLARAIAGDDNIPDEVRQRLMVSGYFKVASGLFRNDAYVLMDQVAHITDDHVHLNVAKDHIFHV